MHSELRKARAMLSAGVTELQPAVLSFWVKSYDEYNRLKETNYDATEENKARAEFYRRRNSGSCYFVQHGVRTTEGSLVLNEWRDHVLGSDDDIAEGSTDFDPGPRYPIKY